MTITLSEYAANLVSERVQDVRKPVKVDDLATEMAEACGCSQETASRYVRNVLIMARYRIMKAAMEMDAANPMVIDDHTPAEQFDA